MHTKLAELGIRRRGWTKEEYYRLADLGFFRGQRVEVIEGQLMVFSPQRTPHATAIACMTQVLPPLFAVGHHVRVQLPMDLGQTTEPEPDVAVVIGDPRAYSQQHP